MTTKTVWRLITKAQKERLLLLPEGERLDALEQIVVDIKERRRAAYTKESARQKNREANKRYRQRHKGRIKRIKSAAHDKRMALKKQGLRPEKEAALADRRKVYAARVADRHQEYRRAWDTKNADKVKEYARRCRERTKAVKMAREQPDELRAILRRQLPGYLDPQSRADILSEATVAILARKVLFSDLGACMKPFIAAHNRMFDYWKTISIDAPVPGTDDLRLIDILQANVSQEAMQHG